MPNIDSNLRQIINEEIDKRLIELADLIKNSIDQKYNPGLSDAELAAVKTADEEINLNPGGTDDE